MSSKKLIKSGKQIWEIMHILCAQFPTILFLNESFNLIFLVVINSLINNKDKNIKLDRNLKNQATKWFEKSLKKIPTKNLYYQITILN